MNAAYNQKHHQSPELSPPPKTSSNINGQKSNAFRMICTYMQYTIVPNILFLHFCFFEVKYTRNNVVEASQVKELHELNKRYVHICTVFSDTYKNINMWD